MFIRKMLAGTAIALLGSLTALPPAWADTPADPAATDTADPASGAPTGQPADGESVAPPDPGAASASYWRVRPAPTPEGETRNYFIVDAEPGDSIADVLVIDNLSDSPLTIAVYGQEAVMTPDGKYSAPPGRAADGSFGTWIAPSVSEVTIPSYETAQIPFTITVPDGATPGDYDGAVFTTAAAPADSDGERMVIDLRVGVRVHLRVAGDLAPAIKISDLEVKRLAPWWNPLPSDVGVSFKVTNTGNVRITAKALTEVAANYMFGNWNRQSGLDSVETPELIPGASVVFSAEPVEQSGAWARAPYFTGLWEWGKQTYTVHIVNAQVPNSDVTIETVTATTEVWLIPWIPAAIILLIVLAFLRWLLRKIFAGSLERRRKKKAAKKEAKKAAKAAAKAGTAAPKAASDAAATDKAASGESASDEAASGKSTSDGSGSDGSAGDKSESDGPASGKSDSDGSTADRSTSDRPISGGSDPSPKKVDTPEPAPGQPGSAPSRTAADHRGQPEPDADKA